MRLKKISLLGALAVGLVGCVAPQPINPSFNVSVNDARATLRQLEDHKVPLDRPLVIVGGYLDPGLGPAGLRRRSATSPVIVALSRSRSR